MLLANRNIKAFTLIELLVVVAIIGILAAVGTVAYQGYSAGAKKNVAKANHKIVCRWVEAEAAKITAGIDSLFEGNISSSSILSTYNSDGNPMGQITQAAVKAAEDDFKNPNYVRRGVFYVHNYNYSNVL